jgi:outer membrane protein
MKRLLIAALLAPGLLFAQAPAGEPRIITLEEAVTLAQRNSPIAVQARGQLRSSDAGLRSAYAAFIPNLSVSANRAYRAGDFLGEGGRIIPVTGDEWSAGTAFSANLNLFDGGRRFHDIRTARAEIGSAEANEITQRFRVSLDVKQAFFSALAARESISAALAQLEQAQQQLRAATARVAAGAATKSDSLRTVILVGNAQLALVTAQNQLQSANATLTRLVGTDYEVTPNPSDTLALDRVSIDSLTLARFAEQGPAVRQAEAQSAAARAAARAARTSYLPSIDLTYSRSGAGDARFGFGDPYAYLTNFRITASMPIFNQLQRESQRVRADVAAVNAEAARRDSRLASQQLLTQHLGALRTAEARMDIQQASVDAGEEDLRVQQQRYAVGASTLLDVLTSQTQLDQARAALIAARYDYRVAKAQLEALVGREL